VYPALLAVTGLTLVGVWRSVVDPWGWYLDGTNALFFPSLIVFAGALVVSAFRAADALAVDHWLAARAAADTAVASALRADVLKVAHHGSRTSTTDAFLARVRPRLAVVSVGAGNSYGHPNTDVLDRLRRAGAEVLRTDAEGAIVARTDGARLDVWTRDRQQWSALMPQDHASSAPR